MTYKKKAIPQATRRAVAERYGCPPGGDAVAECHWCKKPGRIVWPTLYSGRPGAWVWFEHHLDHLMPEFHGGTGDPENIVLACGSCNCSRGSRIIREEGVSDAVVTHARKGREGKGVGREGIEVALATHLQSVQRASAIACPLRGGVRC